jgi:hypothetical protein
MLGDELDVIAGIAELRVALPERGEDQGSLAAAFGLLRTPFLPTAPRARAGLANPPEPISGIGASRCGQTSLEWRERVSRRQYLAGGGWGGIPFTLKSLNIS